MQYYICIKRNTYGGLMIHEGNLFSLLEEKGFRKDCPPNAF